MNCPEYHLRMQRMQRTWGKFIEEMDDVKGSPWKKKGKWRSGQTHNRISARQYSYDSDDADDEHRQLKEFIQPPKSLIYPGEYNYAAFKLKCKRFLKEQMFSERQAKGYIFWVLVDRAADYYTLMMRENRHTPLRQLMKRMEQRFASEHLRETALIWFQNAKQRIKESIEEWAVRLHH
ncbi:hypothetical protein PoB_001158800 [Plakobranchus ocellatus]|uniref:Uncharacterized protein n=1 Tax=Plakobranchus ocellatus TaxID=259542 RepID=A0AAV3YRA0_9GAST|nr:hypothetical protein PoB_001158800 [Plakobranchus ocellatus]